MLPSYPIAAFAILVVAWGTTLETANTVLQVIASLCVIGASLWHIRILWHQRRTQQGRHRKT